jgi:hypothetical protein
LSLITKEDFMTRRTAIYTCAAAALTCIQADAAVKYAKIGGATSGNCDTWANACAMDYAISVATTGDSIWAKKTAGGSPYAPFELKNGVKIIGGFAGTESQPSQSNPATKVTVIDGGGTQPCLYSDGNGSSTVLRGFTISNCANTDSSDWDGGGALVLDNSDAIFVNCIFENNTSVRFGAAVSIRGTGSPKFFNCIFRNNGSGTSGGAQDDNVTPMAGGAIYLHSGTPSFTNCLFYGNKAAEGAVLANMGGAATLTNCTIANNYAKYGYGGAINDGQKKTVLRHCILWENTAIKGGDQIFDVPTGELAVTYSDVQGGWSGTGNINSDPLFVNPGGGNYALQSTSPCINIGSGVLPDDAGDLDWDGNTSEPTPLDLAGNVRVVNAIEIGAYERPLAGSED